jgi:guanylate kinase
MLGTPVFVVTGPSGAGKGTLIRALLGRVPALEVAVSATTRGQRPGEADGRDYWFLTEDDFVRRIEAGEFLEEVLYVSGKRYGTLRSEVERISGAGRICVLELELEGALAVQTSASSSGACASGRPSPPARSASGSSSRATSSSRRIASVTW